MCFWGLCVCRTLRGGFNLPLYDLCGSLSPPPSGFRLRKVVKHLELG